MMPEWAEDLRVYFVASGAPEHVVEQVTLALDAGVRCVQLRLKSAPTTVIYDTAQTLRGLTDRYGALLILNDRVDIALAVGADGVHVGPNDLPVSAIRSFVPEGFIIGGSAGNPARAAQLVASGADYLGVGAIYNAHATKPDASLPQGPEVLRAIRAIADVPLVAIGGITTTNARPCIEAGATGVAVVRALMQCSTSQEMKKAVNALFEASDD